MPRPSGIPRWPSDHEPFGPSDLPPFLFGSRPKPVGGRVSSLAKRARPSATGDRSHPEVTARRSEGHASPSERGPGFMGGDRAPERRGRIPRRGGAVSSWQGNAFPSEQGASFREEEPFTLAGERVPERAGRVLPRGGAVHHGRGTRARASRARPSAGRSRSPWQQNACPSEQGASFREESRSPWQQNACPSEQGASFREEEPFTMAAERLPERAGRVLPRGGAVHHGSRTLARATRAEPGSRAQGHTTSTKELLGRAKR